MRKQKQIVIKYWTSNDKKEILCIPFVNGEMVQEMFNVTLSELNEEGYFLESLSHEQQKQYARIIRTERIEMLKKELYEESDKNLIDDEINTIIDCWC